MVDLSGVVVTSGVISSMFIVSKSFTSGAGVDTVWLFVKFSGSGIAGALEFDGLDPYFQFSVAIGGLSRKGMMSGGNFSISGVAFWISITEILIDFVAFPESDRAEIGYIIRLIIIVIPNRRNIFVQVLSRSTTPGS